MRIFVSCTTSEGKFSFYHFTIKYNVCWKFSVEILYQIKKILSSNLLRCWILSHTLLLYWDNMLNFIFLLNGKTTLYPWKKSYLGHEIYIYTHIIYTCIYTHIYIYTHNMYMYIHIYIARFVLLIFCLWFFMAMFMSEISLWFSFLVMLLSSFGSLIKEVTECPLFPFFGRDCVRLELFLS